MKAISRHLVRIGSPYANLSRDFVEAADRYGLDWRLLPSIAVVESGGGKDFRNQNIFGWANGEQSFSSVRAGLFHVGYRLAHSPLYRGRTPGAKLRTYNPRPDYPPKVLRVMRSLGPRILFERRAPGPPAPPGQRARYKRNHAVMVGSA